MRFVVGSIEEIGKPICTCGASAIVPFDRSFLSVTLSNLSLYLPRSVVWQGVEIRKMPEASKFTSTWVWKSSNMTPSDDFEVQSGCQIVSADVESSLCRCQWVVLVQMTRRTYSVASGMKNFCQATRTLALHNLALLRASSPSLQRKSASQRTKRRRDRANPAKLASERTKKERANIYPTKPFHQVKATHGCFFRRSTLHRTPALSCRSGRAAAMSKAARVRGYR